jgi:trehalose 6-phosphate phosphatase
MQPKNWHESEYGLTGEKAKRLDEFFGAFLGAARPLLLLDYDGTLAPFRLDRYKAQPWAEVRALLHLIQTQEKTRIIVITGRPAAEIPPLLGVQPAPEIWGLHGAERLHPSGGRELEVIPEETRNRLDALCAQLRRDSLGGLFEAKSNAAAIHWRGASPAKAKAIEKRTRALFATLAQVDGLKLLEFEAGLELRFGRDKGEAVAALLEETRHGVPHPAAYLGDDLTDEAAFRAIKEHGLSVLVRRRRRPTSANVWLRPPAELRDFLKRWWQACRGLEADAFAEPVACAAAGCSAENAARADQV